MITIQQWMKAASVPGLAAAVVKDLRMVWAKGFGTTSVGEGGRPVGPDTRFRMGSVTKPLVGAVTLRLAEAGRLDLDAPVSTYLPSFGPPATLRMLLSHTSGLPHHGIPANRGNDPDGLQTFVRDELPRLALVAPPGEVYQYSNPGFAVIGAVLEAVTGQRFDDLMNEWLFRPIGMSLTGFAPDERTAAGHDLGPDGGARALASLSDSVAFHPAGYAFSSVTDLARFAIALMKGQVLGDHGQMFARHARTYAPDDGGYGLAFGVHCRGGRLIVSHSGGVTGFKSLLELHPDEGSAVVLLANRWSEDLRLGPVRDRLRQEWLGWTEEVWSPTQVEPDRSRWENQIGVYLSGSRGLAVVRRGSNGLELEWNGAVMDLIPLGADHYGARRPDGSSVGLGFLPDGERILLDESLFWLMKAAPFTPDPASWVQYAGTYALHKPPMTLRVSDGRLWLHSDYFREEVACEPLSNHRFACKWGYFECQTSPPGLIWGDSHFVPRVSGKEES